MFGKKYARGRLQIGSSYPQEAGSQIGDSLTSSPVNPQVAGGSPPGHNSQVIRGRHGDCQETVAGLSGHEKQNGSASKLDTGGNTTREVGFALRPQLKSFEGEKCVEGGAEKAMRTTLSLLLSRMWRNAKRSLPADERTLALAPNTTAWHGPVPPRRRGYLTCNGWCPDTRPRPPSRTFGLIMQGKE